MRFNYHFYGQTFYVRLGAVYKNESDCGLIYSYKCKFFGLNLPVQKIQLTAKIDHTKN